MTESDNSLAALQVEIRTLCENVARLSHVVEQNTAQLNKLAVLEEKHNHQSAAIDRAFVSMRNIENRMEQHVKDDVTIHAEIVKHTRDVAEANTKEHKVYDKYIYLCIGFIMAVSVFWTLFGVRINSAVEGVVATSTEMQIYMRTHKGATP